MKKNRFFVYGLIALILALTLAGCKDNPITLAKQTYDITQDVVANPLKMVGGLVKAANIKKKVDKLSPADRQIYNEELARLTGQEEGGLGVLGGNSASVGEGLSALLGVLGTLSTSGAAPAAPAEETAKTSGGGGGRQTTFTLTDIPSKYNGKYARISLIGDVILTGAQDITSKAVILPKISNGKVVIPLWVIQNTSSFVKYTGNGAFSLGTVNLYNSGNDNTNAAQKELVDVVFVSFTFSNGNATKSWKDAITVVEQ
jgi:hypothetical protein